MSYDERALVAAVAETIDRFVAADKIYTVPGTDSDEALVQAMRAFLRDDSPELLARIDSTGEVPELDLYTAAAVAWTDRK